MQGDCALSIIIVNWNVCELLRDCLRSLATRVRLPREQWEVLVVDNASSDGSIEMLRKEFSWVQTIPLEQNVGFAAGCNKGYARARGPFILLLNPDTVILDDAIDRMLRTLEARADTGVVGCRLVTADRTFQRSSGGAFPTLRNLAWNYLFLNRILPRRAAPSSLFLERDPQGTFEVDWVSGAAMMIRRKSIGDRLLDESFFMFGEDMEICQRVRRAGWRVLYTSDASVVHYHGRSYAQQSAVDVIATAVRGPRHFYLRSHGKASSLGYDLILLAGYLIRWPVFAVLAWARPESGFKELSILSRAYVLIVLRLLAEKGGHGG